MDLDFSFDNDYRFNARVCAIIYNFDKSKILVSSYKSRDFYTMPGGRINVYEDSQTAIEREIAEELNVKLKFKLKGIIEHFIYWKNKKNMSYEFVFETQLENDNQINLECNDKPEEIFEWMNVKDIKSRKVYPNELNKIMTAKTLQHFVDKREI